MNNEIAPYIPIIVEATKFFLNELSKGLERARLHTKQKAHEATSEELHNDSRVSKQDITTLAQNPEEFASIICANIDLAMAIKIGGLVEQLRIHIKNLNDREEVKAKFGLLTPLNIKHEIDHESEQIIKKSELLEKLLIAAYKGPFNAAK